jgi:hypothetical protein
MLQRIATQTSRDQHGKSALQLKPPQLLQLQANKPSKGRQTTVVWPDILSWLMLLLSVNALYSAKSENQGMPFHKK